MAPSSDGAGIPTHIGKYRVIRPVAQGGMAEIFLATASGIEGFEKLCVIKRILPILAGNRDIVQMFLDEARIAASLHHSNIAQVFDIGVDDGRHYFVMEFLRGEDLYHVMKAASRSKRPIPIEHVVTIMAGVCAGLHYAHELRGSDGKPLQIVHRDVSPQNIFVTHDGNVKLCDFGIAKSTAKNTQTRVGTIKGKVRYMSPEQCQADPLDRRSDLFSLGIVLWELLTLRHLYKAKSDLETFMAITSAEPPAPSRLRPEIPPELDAIVLRALGKKREERFESAQAFQLALEGWARSVALPTSTVGLASYMASLCGAPEPTIDTFLERVTEDDPLARRIRSLNQHRESSDSSLGETSKRQAPAIELDPTVPVSVDAPAVAAEPSSPGPIVAPPRARSRWVGVGAFVALLSIVAAWGFVEGRATSHTPVAAPVARPAPPPPPPMELEAPPAPTPTTPVPTTPAPTTPAPATPAPATPAPLPTARPRPATHTPSKQRLGDRGHARPSEHPEDDRPTKARGSDAMLPPQ